MTYADDNPDDDLRLRMVKANWAEDDDRLRALVIASLMQALDDIGHATGWWMIQGDKRVYRRLATAMGLINGAVDLLNADANRTPAGVKAMERVFGVDDEESAEAMRQVFEGDDAPSA